MKKNPLLSLAASIALAAVFIFAACPKIGNPSEFVASMRNYKLPHSLLPWWSINALALVFPWWELLAGVAILAPSWRRSAALMMTGMGTLFFVMVSQAMLRGLKIECGCFGHESGEAAKVGLPTLALDAFVIVASLYVARNSGKPARFWDVNADLPASAVDAAPAS